MSDISGIKVWTSSALPSDKALTIGDLRRFQDNIRRGSRVAPQVAVMSPRMYEGVKDAERWYRACATTRQVAPFTPITPRTTWKAVRSAWGTLTYRLRKAVRVLRYGYDPEDM